MLLCAVVLAAAAPLSQKLTGVSGVLLIGAVSSVATYALTLLFLRWDRFNPSDIGTAPTRQSPLHLLGGRLVGLVLVTLWALLWALTGYVHWVYSPGVGAATVAVQAIAFLLLATREELAFHAYPLRRLKRSFGLWPAQLLVAVAFAAEHRLGGMTWAQSILGAGMGSILFGMAAIASDGIAVPIGMHAAWNIGHWSLGMKEIPGSGKLWRAAVDPELGARADIAATLAYLTVFSTATLGFWLWNRNRRSRPRTPRC